MADSIKKTTQERVKEITDSIESGIRELFKSDRYQSYLSTMSRFHSYSFSNTVLIHMQRPDATLVAGFNAWRDKFGRHVMRGEKGIQILAPTPVTKKIQQKVLDPETKAPVLDADGTPITEEKSVKLQYYKPVSVFDVSQTEGKPLPELAQSLTGDVAEYETFVEALRRSSPVPIEFEPMAESMDGYFSADKQRIAIRPGMSQVQTVSAMVHEIGHSMLHDYEKLRESASIENGASPVKKDHRTEEVEAESVSYSVCQYYGIETGANSFGYIAAWSKDKKLKELKSSLETIKKTTDSLIKEIDRNLAEIRREHGLDQEKAAVQPEQSEPANTLTSVSENTQKDAVQEPAAEVAVEPAADAIEEGVKTDPYLAYATAVFEHAEELQRAGLIGPPVLPSKEEAANEYAGVLRSGGFSNAKEVLDDFARTSGYPTPDRLYRQMESLAEQWNKELTYQIEANALSPRDSFVTSYHEGKRHETLFYGPTAVGERLLHDLESGRMTPDQARDLKVAWESAGQPFGENELLFGLDDGRAVHLRRTEHRINRFQTDRGYDYTVFNPDGEAVSHGLIRDGEARSYPAYTQIGGAFEAICEKLNADPAKAEAFPLEKLDQLLASNAMEAPDRKPMPAALDEYPMPDAVLRTSDLQATGCTDPTLLPVTLDRATELFADGFSVYTISKDGYPLMVMDQEELDRLSESAPNAVCAIEQNEWEQSRPFHNALNLRHDRQAEREAAFLEYPGDAFAIYQVDVTKSAEFRRRAFLSIEELRQLGLAPDRSFYALAYTGSLAQHPNVTDPEAAYRVFNLERPTDFSGHSLSVSDIVAFKRNGVVTYHYCDSLGFAEVPEFLRPENYLKNAEIAMEDDYGMIDGIINNGPKDSGPPKADPQKEDSHFSPRRLPAFLERGRRGQEQQQAQREQRPRREERSL